MKTIAILSDFSENTFQAAVYALHLAKKIQAKVVLFHVIAAADKAGIVPSFAYASDDEPGIDQDRYDKLLSLCIDLQNQLKAMNFPESFLPEITFDATSDEIVDVMTSIADNDEIILIVTAAGPSKDISTFVGSDQFRKIIGWSAVPVLVVPDSVEIRNPEKIAFLSKLALSDRDHLNSVIDILGPFSPEIMVSYLEIKSAGSDRASDAEDFHLARIVSQADYGRIYFRRIPNDQHSTGWKWLKENKKCDMLVMPSGDTLESDEYLRFGNSPRISYPVSTPIMILPELH